MIGSGKCANCQTQLTVLNHSVVNSNNYSDELDCPNHMCAYKIPISYNSVVMDTPISVVSTPITAHEGSKYLRTINPAVDVANPIRVDVYAVLEAFAVTCPARAHAIKKLLCAGIRGKGNELDDLKGVLAAVNRAIELQQARESKNG